LLKKPTERIRQALSLKKDPHPVLRTPLSQTWERGGGEGCKAFEPLDVISLHELFGKKAKNPYLG
jgi:hypothetical protein